jgi:hypothetical protein
MRTTALWAACVLAGMGGWAMGQDRPVAPAGPARPLAVAPSGVAPSGVGAVDSTPTPIPGLTDKLDLDPKKSSDLLGEPFESQVAGIVFRPPAGSKAVKQTDQDHVVDYVDEDRHWILKVTRARLAQGMALQSVKEAGRERVGLLDYTVADVLKEHPAAEVLRQEIINVGEHGVGMSALRFNIGSQRYLRQQAIFQADEQLYYVFNLTTPAAKEGRPEDNPNERQAAETFRAMIETIELLDRKWIRTDQVNRLFRTRALFTDWQFKSGKRIKDAIVKEAWLRLIRDGKDIGYSYVSEEFVEGKDVKSNPGRAFDGILINVRSRTMEGANQVDIGSQMFSSLDRKHEDWANVVNVVNNKGLKNEDKKQTSEYGFSELRMTRKIDRDAPRDPKDLKAPPGHDVESYKLSVTRPVRDKDTMSKPEYYTPSPWYIPAAASAMLPRLLPLNRPVTYLFQSYVSDQREVMHRYVDVGFEKDVQLGGRTVRAIPISDRIRLEGMATVHYMSPDGVYLGSVNDEAKIVILPTDKATLEKIWKVQIKQEELPAAAEALAPEGR